MRLSQLSGGGGRNRLAIGNTLTPGAPADGAQWGISVSVTNVNITGATITQMASIDVPAGQIISIQAVILSGLTAISGTVDFELEVDGEIVATGTKAASIDTSLSFIGRSTLSSSIFNELVPKDIEARSNIKIRAKKASATAAALNVAFVKLKA